MSWIEFKTSLSVPTEIPQGVFAPDYVHETENLLHGYNQAIGKYVITDRDYPYIGFLEGSTYYKRSGESSYTGYAPMVTSPVGYLYESSGGWYWSTDYGLLPTDGSDTEIWQGALPDESTGTTTFTSCRTSNASADRTLTFHYPRYQSDTQFGIYSAVGTTSTATWQPAGNKTFGSPRWKYRSTWYFIRSATQENGNYVYRSKKSHPDLIYDTTSEKWISGTIPSGAGSWWETDSEPVANSSFTLVQKTREENGDGEFITTQTQSVTCTFDNYGLNIDETATVLLFTPAILS